VVADRLGERVVLPLVAGDVTRLAHRRRDRDVHLEGERPGAAVLAVGGDDLAHRVELGVDRHQAVGPRGRARRRGRAERRADERGRLGGQGVDAGALDGDVAPPVGDLLPGVEPADDLDALLEPLLALVLADPLRPGDVLVHVLAGAEGHPEPAGEHLGERRGGLRDDRRVVALARCVDGTEPQVRRRQRRPEPRPREPGVALPRGPRGEVVGAHGHVEARPLGLLDVAQQLGGGDLLVRGVESVAGHGSCVAWAPPGGTSAPTMPSGARSDPPRWHAGRMQPTLSIAALGGTIGMTAPAPGAAAEPRLDAAALVRGVPQLGALAELRTTTVTTRPSASVTVADVLAALSWARAE